MSLQKYNDQDNSVYCRHICNKKVASSKFIAGTDHICIDHIKLTEKKEGICDQYVAWQKNDKKMLHVHVSVNWVKYYTNIRWVFWTRMLCQQ